MQAGGVIQHVASLQLSQQPAKSPVAPALSGLARWPHLHTLALSTCNALEPGLGSSISQLTGLQSLDLWLRAQQDHQEYSMLTLHANHLRHLTQLTSLSL